ncbi:MAG: T9SS type A sorting domain-containing protein, partial [Bacteroidetes bacterium]|nr:T9SS type A sorting domain-containing protein [Bacteroidota bacterium]
VTPSLSIAPSSSPVCKGAQTTFLASYSNGGSNPLFIWKKNGVIVPFNGSQYTDNTLVTGDQIAATLVSNATCRSLDSVQATPLSLSVTPQSNPGISINSTPVVTICKGSALYFSTTTISPGTAPRYQWYLNKVAISGATAPSYSSTTANNGDTISVQLNSNAVCATDTVAMSNKVGIIVNNLVTPTISASASSTDPTKVPITFTAMSSGGGATPSYQWIVNNVDVPGETGPSYTTSNIRGGDHVAVRMQSYAECANPLVITSSEIVMQGGVGIGSPTAWRGALAVYPNPSNGRYYISGEQASLQPGETLHIEVMNMTGQRVYESELKPNMNQGQWRAEIELGSEIASGPYMLHLSTRSGMSALLPLSLQR